ncbi:hypothetical protein DAI22_09g070166 [Oryza sativa Japonica Group]|nr:hypothetical protein DAI22_09g070166 [Oryza sativa Japonica Group]
MTTTYFLITKGKNWLLANIPGGTIQQSYLSSTSTSTCKKPHIQALAELKNF